MKVVGGNVRVYKVTKIGWLRRADSFISERGNLEDDALVYGEASEVVGGWGKCDLDV